VPLPLTAHFSRCLLTGGVGIGIIVSIEAGHFLRATAGVALGGCHRDGEIREFSRWRPGLMIAAVSGTQSRRPDTRRAAGPDQSSRR